MQSEKKEFLSRTELLLGEDGVKRLSEASVIIFGVGGVGGYTLEALVRSGVEKIALVDADTVSLSNINRQIIATRDTVGRPKVEVARERALSINPDAKIRTFPIFYEEKTENEIDLSEYDYVIDAIDTVTSKLRLIENAKSAGVSIISSMGAGNKLDPTAFKVADVYKTSVCPLARVIRTELKRRGIKKLKCVYSEEPAIKAVAQNDENIPKNRHTPASLATIPSVVGLIIANEVIKDISKINKQD